MQAPVSGAVLLAHSLARLGIVHVHAAQGALPPVLATALCHRAGLKLVLGSSEQTAAWSAVGSASLGQLACCFVAQSPGALQALPALQHALATKTPVVLVFMCAQAVAQVIDDTLLDEAPLGTAESLAAGQIPCPRHGIELVAAVSKAAALAEFGPALLPVPVMLLHGYHAVGTASSSAAAPAWPINAPRRPGTASAASAWAADDQAGASHRDCGPTRREARALRQLAEAAPERGAACFVASGTSGAALLRAAGVGRERAVLSPDACTGADMLGLAVGAALARRRSSGAVRGAALCVLCSADALRRAPHELVQASRAGLPLLLLVAEEAPPSATVASPGELEGGELARLSAAAGCAALRMGAAQGLSTALRWAYQQLDASRPAALLDWPAATVDAPSPARRSHGPAFPLAAHSTPMRASEGTPGL